MPTKKTTKSETPVKKTATNKENNQDKEILKEIQEQTDMEQSSAATDASNDMTDDAPVSVTPIDPDITALRNLPEDEQLWFFIDDIVPRPGKDTEVIVIEDGPTDEGIPCFTLYPQSLNILDEIANVTDDVKGTYSELVKYFPDIIRLYHTFIKPDISPYWAVELLEPATPSALQTLMSIQLAGLKGYLSLTAKPDATPCRLLYGDESHKHDFVGIVYLYAV